MPTRYFDRLGDGGFRYLWDNGVVYRNAQHDQGGSFALGNADAVNTIEGIDASNYVDGAGGIELSIKHLVFVPFFAFTFESWIDWVEIAVE